MADANGFSPLSEAPAEVRLAAAWEGCDVTHPLTRFRPLEPDAGELANLPPGQQVRWQAAGPGWGGGWPNVFLVEDDVTHAAERLARPDRLQLEDGDSLPTTVDSILPGDWITSRNAWAGMVTGRVIERAKAQTLGDGFKVRTIRGVEDFIANGDVVIMGYMDCRPPETGEGDA